MSYDPTEYMFINKRRAQGAARTAIELGLGARAHVQHHRYQDEQGYIVVLYDWERREKGALHPDGLVAEAQDLDRAA